MTIHHLETTWKQLLGNNFNNKFLRVTDEYARDRKNFNLFILLCLEWKHSQKIRKDQGCIGGVGVGWLGPFFFIIL